MTTNEKRLKLLEEYLTEALQKPSENVRYIQDLVLSIGRLKFEIQYAVSPYMMVN
jgi:hypothetical protein